MHGRLGQEPTAQLVLTSADFGRAYLTDAWAARFVARLFADFTVLFIGYSLNDPVLRYMTDAFAAENAEKRYSQSQGPAYIFVPYKAPEVPDGRTFIARNLEPIFYNSERAHALLKDTVVAWADARADYLSNVSRLVREIAPRQPDSIDPTDTANLMWAVIGRPNDDGHGARVFSDVDDLPPIEWLDMFEAKEGSTSAAHEKSNAEAVHAGRPQSIPPQLHIQPLFPRQVEQQATLLSSTSLNLIPWFIRHLATEGWVSRCLTKLGQGRSLHPRLKHAIRDRLAQEPSLLPGFTSFWRIVSAEGSWVTSGNANGFGPTWILQHVRTHKSQPWFYQELLASLRPQLTLSPSSFRSYRRAMEAASGQVPVEQIGERLSHLAESEVTFSEADYVPLIIDEITTLPEANAYWATHLDDLTGLLAEALHLYSVVGEADQNSDPSIFQRQSIVPHSQNRTNYKWTLLFDLIWRGWTHVDAVDSRASRSTISRWRSIPYLSFRRLVLAAVNSSGHFNDAERLEVLLDA